MSQFWALAWCGVAFLSGVLCVAWLDYWCG